MDPDTLARAAEPFFTTKGVGKGTGLGLSMVHGLAAQSGGALRLSSRQGEGTSVDLWLPISNAAAPESSVTAPRELVAAHRPLKILVVDDDPLVAMGTVAMLEDLGHAVTDVGSGVEALAAMAANENLDLVITDQAMPGMTGIELAASLRKTHPSLPVVLASGYADLPTHEGDLITLPRLSKPFGQAEVARVIADVLAGEREPVRCDGADAA